jgi:hypothetical protein
MALTPGFADQPVLLNTIVRVGYTVSAARTEASSLHFMVERTAGWIVAIVYDVWGWWIRCGVVEREIQMHAGVVDWEVMSGERETGVWCLSRRIQVLTGEGWMHVNR